jgi:hypothetical protein
MYEKYAVRAVYAFGFFLFFGLQKLFGWPFLGGLHVRSHPAFIDLGPTINALECYRLIGLRVYSVGDSSSCWYIYGSTLLKVLAPTGLTTASTITLGWIFIGIASTIFGIIFSLIVSDSKLINLFYLLVLLSPVTMLLLERGNIDIIILLLLTLSALAFNHNLRFLTVLLILCSSLIKFYTLPLALIFCLFVPNKRRKLIGLLLISLTFFRVISDLRLLEDLPRVANASFGNPLLAMYLTKININLPWASQHMIGIFFLFCAVIFIRRIRFSRKIFNITPFPNIENWNYANTLQMIFMITFLSCYFAGVSFDFRLIYFTLACLLEVARTYNSTKLFSVYLGFALISNWTVNTKYLEPFGDLSILLVTAYFLILLQPQAEKLIRR